jgi:signal-transduction protein with cAMP-binding, CBS, and nucleotidyltransferase domain
MRIADICTRSVVTCGRRTSATEAAQLMREHHVGDLVVVEERDGKVTPVAVVTDRDLVIEVMAQGLDPALAQVGDLIVDELVTAAESEFVHDAVWHMRGKGIRRLPVTDAQGKLTGVLTAGDVSRCLAEELIEIARIAPTQVRRESVRRSASRP